MKIAKPAEDFWKAHIQRELQKNMSPDAWLDLAHSIMIDWRKMKTITTLRDRISFGLYHLKQALRTHDIFFLGLDHIMKPALYSCTWGMKESENCDDTVQDFDFDEKEEKLYCDASRISIGRGGPVEFREGFQYGEDILKRANELRSNMTLVTIPVYAHLKTRSEEKEDALVGAVGFFRPSERPPITESIWMQIFYMVFELGDAICAASQEYPDCVLKCHPIPDSAEIATASWKSGVRCLLRWNLDTSADASGIRSVYDAVTWLRGAVSSLGYAEPQDMKPNELLQSIEKSLSKREADEISHTASETAYELSKSASSAEWNETAGTIISTMGAIFEQTPTIYFAMVNYDQDEKKKQDEFHILHTKSVLCPDDDEQKALQVLAQWVGLTGKPLYLSPGEGRNKILQQVRETTTQKAPLFAIPVYGWRKNKSMLHGVFIGFRREGAPQPSLAAWLTWVYTAQNMLWPIDTASRHGKLKYRPIYVERTLVRAAAPVEKMLLPWKSCKALRRTKPVD